MSERTRYGDLTRAAVLHLNAAAIMLRHEQFTSLATASAAVSAYADLHEALYRLGWQLRGGPTTGVLTPAPEHRTPRQAAELELLEQVGRLAARHEGAPVPWAGAAGHWHQAAVQLRTAGDLLGTHHRPYGQPRTPHSPNLADPRVAGPAWAQYADLARTAVRVAEQLAVAARAAGVTPERVRGLSWAGERITRAADSVTVNLGATGRGWGLRDLEVANPAVRTTDPLLELGDRLGRVHTAAWENTRRGTMTVPTLTDLAAAGVLLHAATHRTLITTGTADRDLLQVITTHGTAWRQVHANLADLRSIDPIPGGIRADLRALQRLLPTAETDPRSERVQGVLVDACRSHDRVAEWSATAITDLTRHDQLYLLGRALTSDDLTENINRVTAKFTNTLTLAPDRHIANILANYATAARAPVLSVDGHRPMVRSQAPTITVRDDSL